MSGHQNRRFPLAVAAVTLALLAASTSAAQAHTHPTPTERASPGVVYIEARAMVEVALIEHRQVGDPSGIHIAIRQSTWTPVLDTASGFVVDPTGAIVTTGTVTRPDLERAWIFGVNQAFHQAYGDAAPLPKDPFSRHRIADESDHNQQRLEACYPPNVTNDAGGCVVRVTPDFVVYPYVTSQKRYGALHAEVLPGGTPDVAVLRVRGANSMPTVAVASSAAGAKALGVLGFTGVPGPANPLLVINQHLAKPGGSQLKTTGLDAEDVKDAARLNIALHQGLQGGPVLAERGQVIGLLPAPAAPGSAAPPLVGVASILPVIQKAGVSPHGGPVDTSFEAAMHLFKNGGYAASVPGFTKALELFPGHFLASRNVAIAKQRAASGVTASGTQGHGAAPEATAADETSGSGLGWLWPGLLIAITLLVAGSVLFLVLRGRRTPVGALAGTPDSGRSSSGGRRPPGAPGSPGAPPRGGSRAPGAEPARAAEGAAVGAAAARGGRPAHRSDPSRAASPVGATPSARPRTAAPSSTGSAPTAATSAAAAAATAAAAAAAADQQSTTVQPPHNGAADRPSPQTPAPGHSSPGHSSPGRSSPVHGAAGSSTSASRVAPPRDPAPDPARDPAPAPDPAGGPTPLPPPRPGATPRFCTSCGGRLAAQHQFCGWCGEPVR